MNDLETIKAKKKLRRNLENNQWRLGECQPEETSELIIYCYDPFDTKQLSMAGLTKNNLIQLIAFKEPVTVISGTVSQVFSQYVLAKGNVIQKRAWELGVLAGAYAVKTSTYEQLMLKPVEAGMHRHFVILLYRNRHTGETTLRPFSLVSDKEILSIDEVKALSLPVIKRDELVNPGYFNSSPVIPIKE